MHGDAGDHLPNTTLLALDVGFSMSGLDLAKFALPDVKDLCLSLSFCQTSKKLLKAIVKYRYGLRKNVSKHLKRLLHQKL